MTEQFFYTTDTPHQWSSGQKVISYNIAEGRMIASLEEARELALAARRGRRGYDDYVRTSYGVMYDTEEEA